MFSLQHHFPRSSLTCFNRPSGQRPHYTLKRAKRVARATGVAGVTQISPNTCNAGAILFNCCSYKIFKVHFYGELFETHQGNTKRMAYYAVLTLRPDYHIGLYL